MKTRVIQVDPFAPDADAVAQAMQILQNGGLVAYATETVYGLSAAAFDPIAVQHVFDVKQRPVGQALPVQVGDVRALAALTRDLPPIAGVLADRFFPGPLTLVLPKHPDVPLLVTGGQDTVGIRMPDHRVPLSVLRAFGGPLVCPSANVTGRRAPMSATDVLEDFDGLIDLVLDSGPTADRTASTVLDLTVSPARLLREGKISRQELEAILPIAPPGP